ncbi:hypothetical protein F2Q69_00002416 [Brassica cretica]|uniref:Uncharacterized protein n=1 Tax=Brassica cretica TaxID=69181 RepID=A0A8S9PHG3_BRACR|nr:hypothetical protein F2Q69_00002416 [Brassica cretica]
MNRQAKEYTNAKLVNTNVELLKTDMTTLKGDFIALETDIKLEMDAAASAAFSDATAYAASPQVN